MARNRVWVRGKGTKTVVGASTDVAGVQSLRTTLFAGSVAQGASPGFTLPSEFTVVRFLAWLSGEELNTAAGLLSNPFDPVFGVRVGGIEEYEELVADAVFRAESGPTQDPQADWMVWAPVQLDNIAVPAEGDIFRGKLMVDIRSARRIDSASDDLLLFGSHESSAITTSTRSIRWSYAALCLT